MSRATVVSNHQSHPASVRRYSTGFVSSVLLSCLAFWLVSLRRQGSLSTTATMILIGGLALTQCAVQLTLFLHLGHEAKPRSRLLAFGFMLAVLAIVVFGSLWIMHNLDYNMMHMSPDQIMDRMHTSEGL